MGRIRVLVADDEPTIFNGIRQILEPACEIVGEVRDGLDLLAAAEQLRPDVIVADITMPRLGGIEAVRTIKKHTGGIAAVFLSMHTEPAYVTAAFKAGGSGYVLKSSAADELLPAIVEALKGRKFLTPALASGTVAAGDLGKSPSF
jgi:DNA-binding NarL/FixJ family response regulator